MICGTCGEEKLDGFFTKLNRSKDGKRGLCKECKKQRDAEYRKNKDIELSELPKFKLIPDLILRNDKDLILRKDKARIGVLVLERITGRRLDKGFFGEQNAGLMAVLSELKEPYEYCRAEQMNNYSVVLISLTSVMDVENLIYTFEKYAPTEITAEIIVGGFGVLNIKLITPYIDAAVFGRAEGQINEIIAGAELDNVWRKKRDPFLEQRYEVRQPKYLVKGENGVGCRNRCKFCQYTWTRRALSNNQKYNPGQGMTVQETDWNGLSVAKPGRYTTAWDGWSETSRLRVAKLIRDKDIVDKLLEIDAKKLLGTVHIKVFQIVGYPWETRESVGYDMEQAAKLLAIVDREIETKISLGFLLTPFGPEPLTPMKYDLANIYENWSDNIKQTHLYRGKMINAYIIPVISGPFTLVKRVFIHRAETAQLEQFKAIAFSGRLKRMPEKYRVPWLLAHKEIDERMFGEIEAAAFDYLYIGG